MATAIASSDSATSAGTTVTITKPSGLAVGDIMVAFCSCIIAGASTTTWTDPSGWTELAVVSVSNDASIGVFAIVATSTETAASNFAFQADGGDADNVAGAIFRVTGTNGFTSLAANVTTTSGSSTGTSSPSVTGLTTQNADGVLLIQGWAVELVDGDMAIGSYAVVNNDPTWTEEYDIYNEPSGIANNLGIASATYTLQQATGNFSCSGDQSSDWAGAMVSVTEDIDVTVSPAVITATGTVQAPTVTGTAVASPAVITATAAVQAPTITAGTSKWINTDKSANSSFTNTTKS